MTRLRTPKELKPLPKAFRDLVERGELVDIRAQIPVHDQFGQPGFAFPQRQLSDIQGLCIHHTGGSNQDPVETARYHASVGEHITNDARGCPSICYVIAVPDDGRRLLVNDPTEATYSQGPGANKPLLAIVFMGKFSAYKDPSVAQMKAADDLVPALQEALGLDKRGVFSHAELGKPDCPGKRLEGAVKRYRLAGKANPAKDPNGAIMSGSVVAAQRKLMAFGFPLPVFGADGEMGDETRGALGAFQRTHGIPVTGVLDVFTAFMLGHCLVPGGAP